MRCLKAGSSPKERIRRLTAVVKEAAKPEHDTPHMEIDWAELLETAQAALKWERFLLTKLRDYTPKTRWDKKDQDDR